MRNVLAVTLSILLGACASTQASGGRAASANLINREQILRTGAESVYEVVSSLKNHWLTGTGDSRGRPPVVFKDHLQMGGVEELKGMSAANAHTIEWLDLSEAGRVVTGPMVNGAASGVIVVWTTHR